MAKYRELIIDKPQPDWTDSNQVMAGSNGIDFTIAIGNLRVCLTAAEVRAIQRTWNAIGNGELKRGEESKARS